MDERFTFAVVGHNEALRLHYAVTQALEAAALGDRVWFVNSGSTDDSAVRAAALGAEVIDAPLGKGRALEVAFERCRDGYLCFIDADMESSERNIPAALREAVVATAVDMVVGKFSQSARRTVIQPALYHPLTRALFPETRDAQVSVPLSPLSGLRAVRTGLDLGVIPPGYGVETHLNIRVCLSGGSIRNCVLGAFGGPLRRYMNLAASAADVAAAILDLAVAYSRLSITTRPLWQAWVDEVVSPLSRAVERGVVEERDFEEALAAGARPLPTSTIT